MLLSLLSNISKENLKVEDSALEDIVYFTQGDMRKSINILQASTTSDKSVTTEAVLDVINRAKPKSVRKMIMKALDHDFMGARDELRDIMIMDGVSGDDLISQMYQEVNKMTNEKIIPETDFIKLMEYMSECDYRIREGSNARLQIEALLSKFLIVKQEA